MAISRHISWKYRIHGKLWQLTREILCGTTHVKNEVIIERYRILPKFYIKNNCKQHPTADLIFTEGCAVKFVYIFQNVEGDRRWIGGLTRSFEVAPICKICIITL